MPRRRNALVNVDLASPKREAISFNDAWGSRATVATAATISADSRALIITVCMTRSVSVNSSPEKVPPEIDLLFFPNSGVRGEFGVRSKCLISLMFPEVVRYPAQSRKALRA